MLLLQTVSVVLFLALGEKSVFCAGPGEIAPKTGEAAVQHTATTNKGGRQPGKKEELKLEAKEERIIMDRLKDRVQWSKAPGKVGQVFAQRLADNGDMPTAFQVFNRMLDDFNVAYAQKACEQVLKKRHMKSEISYMDTFIMNKPQPKAGKYDGLSNDGVPLKDELECYVRRLFVVYSELKLCTSFSVSKPGDHCHTGMEAIKAHITSDQHTNNLWAQYEQDSDPLLKLYGFLEDREVKQMMNTPPPTAAKNDHQSSPPAQLPKASPQVSQKPKPQPQMQAVPQVTPQGTRASPQTLQMPCLVGMDWKNAKNAAMQFADAVFGNAKQILNDIQRDLNDAVHADTNQARQPTNRATPTKRAPPSNRTAPSSRAPPDSRSKTDTVTIDVEVEGGSGEIVVHIEVYEFDVKNQEGESLSIALGSSCGGSGH